MINIKFKVGTSQIAQLQLPIVILTGIFENIQYSVHK